MNINKGGPFHGLLAGSLPDKISDSGGVIMNQSMQNCLVSLKPGEGKTFLNMTVFPLIAQETQGPGYITLGEAFSQGTMSIREVNESGHVPELWAVNKGDNAVLILDGEELRGAKQNRILNASVLLKEHSETIIPVSCTEQGRWHSVGPEFADSGYVASSGIRAKKMQSVASSLQSQNSYQSDQGEVWNQIHHLEETMGRQSSTHAMRDTFESQKKDLDELLKSFPRVLDQRGLAVFINGVFTGLELVSLHSAYQKYHEKFIQSYGMNALMARKKEKTVLVKEGALEKVMQEILTSQHQSFPSIGYGKDYRYRDEHIIGAALIYQKTPIHAAFFKLIPDWGRGKGPIRRDFHFD